VTNPDVTIADDVRRLAAEAAMLRGMAERMRKAADDMTGSAEAILEAFRDDPGLAAQPSVLRLAKEGPPRR
jgi:hypothetical protein